MTLTGILSYLAVINLTGFAAFGIDKYKAIHHKWRIRESALFAIAILGGSVGCLIGMHVFHHKTLHPSFRIGIPMILIVELIVGCVCFYTISNRTPYRQYPVKVVRHELSSLSHRKNPTLQKHLMSMMFSRLLTINSPCLPISPLYLLISFMIFHIISEISRNRGIRLRSLFPLPHLTAKHWQKNTPVR